MRFSYNFLQSFFSKKLPRPEKLAELLTMHSFEVSKISKIENQKSKIDWILDIEVFPNRGPDSFSHLGIARECSALTNLKLEIRNSKPKENKNLKAKDFISVEVKNQEACPRYTARVIFDVKIGPSPKWIQERLEACGIKPISNIVDIANYVMLETGQPLHAFDFDKIESPNQKSEIQSSKLRRKAFGFLGGRQIQTKKIIVRFAKRGEKIFTLDKEKYNLDEDILVIADEKKPVAIAGIKGALGAEIEKKTKIVALESANFNPKIIRRTSRKLNLKTDASWRFEHGIDPNLTEFAINRAAYLIQEIAGGKVAQGMVDFYPKKVLPKKIKLDFNYIESLIGVKIPLKKVIKILKDLNFKVTSKLTNLKTDQLLVEVPTFRLDISIPEDLIEEIGRIYGYQKIESRPCQFSISSPRPNEKILFEKKIKEIFKAFGFTETLSYSFISQKDFEFLKQKNLIEIENPTSQNAKYLRTSLLPNLLKLVSFNQKEFPSIKIFEIGKIYFKEKKDLKEKRMLGGLISGKNKFFKLKGYLEALFEALKIKKYSFFPHPKESKYFLQEKTAEIEILNKKIGFLGEISKEVLEFYNIEIPIFAFEIDLEVLISVSEKEIEYLPFSLYPSLKRDLAVIVSKSVLAKEVEEKIRISGGKLLSKIEIFDVYQGPPLPEDKKNLAFHLFFQSKKRTLTSKEIEKKMKKIIQFLERQNWKVRTEKFE